MVVVLLQRTNRKTVRGFDRTPAWSIYLPEEVVVAAGFSKGSRLVCLCKKKGEIIIRGEDSL